MLYAHTFNFAATYRHHQAPHIEFVPTHWVMRLANPKIGNTTDLTPGGPERVSLTELWDDMLQNGMRDPFILAAGRQTQEARLESGNHRIGLFAAHGVDFVPAVALVGDDCIVTPVNGQHRFKLPLKIPLQIHHDGVYQARVYMKPSDVFMEMGVLRSTGQMPPALTNG